jgi:hypothetical protein
MGQSDTKQGDNKQGDKKPSTQPPDSQTKEPESDKTAGDGAEVKQGVIRPEDTRGTGPRRLKAPGMKGSYMGVVFNDEGESDVPVSEDVASALKKQFPSLSIEEIE